jgi:hypothetical protein
MAAAGIAAGLGSANCAVDGRIMFVRFWAIRTDAAIMHRASSRVGSRAPFEEKDLPRRRRSDPLAECYLSGSVLPVASALRPQPNLAPNSGTATSERLAECAFAIDPGGLLWRITRRRLGPGASLLGS